MVIIVKISGTKYYVFIYEMLNEPYGAHSISINFGPKHWIHLFTKFHAYIEQSMQVWPKMIPDYFKLTSKILARKCCPKYSKFHVNQTVIPNLFQSWLPMIPDDFKMALGFF